MEVGKIIFFKGIYGYISSPDYPNKLFFHRNDVLGDYAKRIKRGDEVRFKPAYNIKRPEQRKSTQIEFLSYQAPSLESLRIQYDPNDIFVGHLEDWNGRSGHIKSKLLQEKDAFLYYN